MKTARWNWIVLVVASGICLFLGIVGVIVGALRVTQEPVFLVLLSLAVLISALVLRRSYKRYEAEVLPLAAEVREPASETDTRVHTPKP